MRDRHECVGFAVEVLRFGNVRPARSVRAVSDGIKKVRRNWGFYRHRLVRDYERTGPKGRRLSDFHYLRRLDWPTVIELRERTARSVDNVEPHKVAISGRSGGRERKLHCIDQPTDARRRHTK